VEAALAEHGLGGRVRELPASTRTAVEAAATVGCEVGQIVKSLVFRTAAGTPVLVVASGANRVDEARVEAIVGEKVSMADADFVRERTGYAIGGVPPLAHATELAVIVDPDLRRYDEVWAAAGTPRAVFPVTPDELLAVTGGRVAAVAG
jgi:prolyl-tRNA editing enzyme YbaK/EbsC (Cys-tRNA(Pro) deacylase)